ncbi:PIN domain-containing protein [Actinokineospora sp. NBRC 105648]|uniref:PIN domain-containing protein n=1 Tax=Actinokineospora sp. NBRC 105648 TaxID=3032206 RepID=UPI0024A46A6D|nr:PIN domain-containing protein [Actinokineospora sp. NBRC 105648]GLZ42479.1 PIN domain-containing protein [Actinokineospora sp. NBRC 105648]
MPFPSFLDACVLVPMPLADLLLRMAEADLYRPLWSEEVLDEVTRSLPKLGVTPLAAARRVKQMRDTFPDAAVPGCESLVSVMRNHPKDRHVLAAAVRANAELIVTANLRDFPPDALDPYDIVAVQPDDFLLDQFDLYPEDTLRCLREQVAALREPPESMNAFLTQFAKTAPTFASAVRDHLDDRT